MKRKIVLAVAAFLLVLQAQAVFAADNYRDFLSAINDGNFSKAERIIKNNARKWSINEQANCWFGLAYYELKNSPHLRAAQLLNQYKVSFDDTTISSFMRYKASEELCRYLISIGMPIGNGAIGIAVNNNYTDNFVQFLLEKGGTLNNWALQTAAQKKRWTLFPDLINKSTEDYINYRQTREEFTTWYNSQSADYRSKNPFNYDPSESKTALMFAAQYGQMRIVRLLVEKGARVNLRADDGSTAASLAYDNGEIDIYDYLKANGARDFEPRQAAQQPAAPAPAPAQSTTNVYVQPTAPAQSTPAQPAPRPAAPTLRPGRYAYSGSNITMDIASPLTMVTLYSGYTAVAIGNYTINGNTLVISILRASSDDYKFMVGRTYDYTITSDSSFSGQGERWVRTGN